LSFLTIPVAEPRGIYIMASGLESYVNRILYKYVFRYEVV